MVRVFYKLTSQLLKDLLLLAISPKFKRNLAQIIPFGIIWVLIGWLTLWTEYAVVSQMDEVKWPESAISWSTEIIVFVSISVFLIGCFVGLLEITFINRLFIKSSFPKKILSKLFIYTILLGILVFITYMIAASIDLDQPIYSEDVFDKYLIFLFSITNVSTAIQISFSLALSLLYAEISDNLGYNVLLNFFTGKYHKPVIENRIFMFTDMKNSTAIAEKLGNVEYFDLLRSYYDDLSDAIVNNYGEVYQYIGAEIVISWNSKKEQVVERSLQCYFDMKSDLAKRRDYYLKTYGLFPDFKAGIHIGEVTTGEIGALKKEIFFTGDVLNTTARIQGLCKNYGVDILTSEDLIQNLIQTETYLAENLGEAALKGKENKLNLYTITTKNK